MESFIVRKNGFLISKEWKYNNEKEKGRYHYTLLKPEKFNIIILSYLDRKVKLCKDFTVRDWFKLVINYPKLQELDEFMDSYIEEYNKSPKSNCISKEIDYISIKKIVEFNNYRNKRKLGSEIYDSVSGINVSEKISYAIEFMNVGEYLDTPLKLEDGVTYKELMGKLRNIKTQTFSVNYTLYDLVKSFIWEISFCGTPENRDKKESELFETLKEVKKEFEKQEELKK